MTSSSSTTEEYDDDGTWTVRDPTMPGPMVRHRGYGAEEPVAPLGAQGRSSGHPDGLWH